MTNRKSSTAAGHDSKAPDAQTANSPDATAKDAVHSDKHDATAYERGANAGKQKEPHEGNPYPDGSHAAKSFEHGQLDAQKVRSSDKPSGR